MLSKIVRRLSLSISGPQKALIDQDIDALLKGGWSIGSDDKAVLVTELERFLQYENIKVLDIGSGSSTLIFLKHILANHRNATMDVVEEDLDWISRIKAMTDVHLKGSVEKVSFNFINCNYDNQTGFNFGILDHKLQDYYDIIFVDAPPDTTVADGRYLLARKLIGRLKSNGILIIHDVHRNTELYAFERLKPFFRRAELFNTGKGIGVLSFPLADEGTKI